MKNVQISFDENLLKAVDRFATTTKLSRSAVVRKALKRWLKEQEVKEFENQWIRKLKQHPDEAEDLDTWVQAEHWSNT